MTNSLNPERMDFAGKSKVSLAELKEIIEHVHIYF